MFVVRNLFLQSKWFIGDLLQSEWDLLQLHSSQVVHLAEQFLFIVPEFLEYYKEKCMSHTVTPGEQFVFIVLESQQYYNENCMICKRHYYYRALRKAAVLNTM